MTPAYVLDEAEVKKAVAEFVIRHAEARVESVSLTGPAPAYGAVVTLAGNPKPREESGPCEPPKAPEPGSIEAQIAQFDDEMRTEDLL